jgi:plasmid maintenance system antidote protein VapI
VFPLPPFHAETSIFFSSNVFVLPVRIQAAVNTVITVFCNILQVITVLSRAENGNYYIMSVSMGKSFRGNLRDELDYLGMTVKELAAKANVAKGALDSYLGKQSSMPPADVAIRIAAALNVSVEYLVTGTETRRGRSLASLDYEIRLVVKALEKLPNGKRKAAAKAACALANALEETKQCGKTAAPEA